MAFKLPPPEVQPSAPLWMVTFADMITLLFAFFVMLFSFSNIKTAEFATMAESMRSAFGLRSPLDLSQMPGGSQVLPEPAPAHSDEPTKTPLPAKMMLVNVRKALEKSGLQDQGEVEVTERGVVLRLAGDAVFDPGRTDLAPGAEELLSRLVQLASTSAGEIEVEGHTDDRPIRNSLYPSNWELSTARAGSAVRHLASRGLPPGRLKAIGYADTRPLVPNDSAENRTKNRRIELVFVGPGDRAAAAGTPASIGEIEPAARDLGGTRK